MTILVLYGTTEGHTVKIADHLAQALRQRGQTVEVIDVGQAHNDLALATYDAVVIGASIHIGKHPPCVGSFVKRHLSELRQRPTAFFSVSLTARRSDERGRQVAAQYIDQFLKETGWQPARTATFAGALLFSQYGLFKRLMMRTISRLTGGDTDTSRDYVYTDWAAVAAFADAVIELLPPT